MAQFNLQDYETVEERLKRFWADSAHADARLQTFNRTTDADREKGLWVIETRLYLTREDQEADLPKTTGWAFEVDGGKGANQFAALENAETSSLGRCLANYALSGNRRSSREEMAKVARETLKRDWVVEAKVFAGNGDVDGLRLLYTEADAAKADEATLEEIKSLGYALRK